MKRRADVPIHSIAVSLLAAAVIVLAIKEPRCDCNTPAGEEEPQRQQTTAPTRSRTGIQRELGKF